MVRARPLVSPETVFAGTDQGVAYAFDKGDGTVRWRTGVGGTVVERLALLPAGLVVAAAEEMVGVRRPTHRQSEWEEEVAPGEALGQMSRLSPYTCAYRQAF